MALVRAPLDVQLRQERLPGEPLRGQRCARRRGYPLSPTPCWHSSTSPASRPRRSRTRRARGVGLVPGRARRGRAGPARLARVRRPDRHGRADRRLTRTRSIHGWPTRSERSRKQPAQATRSGACASERRPASPPRSAPPCPSRRRGRRAARRADRRGRCRSRLRAGAPRNFPALQWHGDTFDLPEGATLLASSPAYRNQAFAYRNAHALEFHIEVPPELAREWAEVPAYAQEPRARARPGRVGRLPRRRGGERPRRCRSPARCSGAGSSTPSVCRGGRSGRKPLWKRAPETHPNR